MNLFPLVAITNFHKHSGLKQQNFLLDFWRLEAQNQVPWAKFFLESLGESPYPCLFHWLVVPFQQRPHSDIFWVITFLCRIMNFSPSFYRDPWKWFGTTQIIQDNLSISRYLITCSKSVLLCNVFISFKDQCFDILGGHYSAQHTTQ